MKKIILLILALVALVHVAMFAQEKPDSTVQSVENRNGTFFKITRDFYPTGRILTDESPIGDTAAMVNAFVGTANAIATQLAIAAVAISNAPEANRSLNEISNAVQSIAGFSLWDEMDRRLSSVFLPDTATSVAYIMRPGVGATPVNVTLRRNANGRLVLRQGSTNFLIEIRAAEYIRIRRYDGSGTQAADGVSLDLFYKQTRNGPRWVSIDNAFVLRDPALTIQSN
jgi:hypothetical protein